MSGVQNDCFATRHLSLCKQYLNEATADVFFICGTNEQKERVPAHKFVLFANSDVFDKMFHGSSLQGNEIEISDASPNGFRIFLRYFYFEECLLDIDVVGEMMYLAKKYNIGEYFDLCCKFLRTGGTTAKRILVGYELAIAYELLDLQEYFEYERINNDVLGSEYIRSITLGSLLHIAVTYGSCSSAKNVFDACMKWAEEACNRANVDPSIMQNRRQQLDDCLDHIEFGAMKRDEIVQCMTEFWDLFTQQELREFTIMNAAKFPAPFNEDKMIQYDIGETTMLDPKIEVAFTSLHFISVTRTLLGGIVVVPFIYDNLIVQNSSVVVRISKIMKDKQKYDNIILLVHNYDFRGRSSNNSHDGLIFPEAIIIESNSSYSIQLEIFDGGGTPLYYEHSISVSNEIPFKILPETNRNVISAFLCNKLT